MFTMTEMILEEDGFALEPLVPETFDFRLCGRRRMLDCVAKDWRSVVRSKPNGDGLRSYFHMMLGRTGGKWWILR
jgi:hypothetical protein